MEQNRQGKARKYQNEKKPGNNRDQMGKVMSMEKSRRERGRRGAFRFRRFRGTGGRRSPPAEKENFPTAFPVLILHTLAFFLSAVLLCQLMAISTSQLQPCPEQPCAIRSSFIVPGVLANSEMRNKTGLRVPNTSKK